MIYIYIDTCVFIRIIFTYCGNKLATFIKKLLRNLKKYITNGRRDNCFNVLKHERATLLEINLN